VWGSALFYWITLFCRIKSMTLGSGCSTLSMGTRCEVFTAFFSKSDEVVDSSAILDVWHKNIPSKVSLFAWRLFRNRLPTKDNLARRSILPHTDIACLVGCGTPESVQHLFIGCALSNRVWQYVRIWLGIDYVASNNICQHFVQFVFIAGMPRSTFIFFKVIWLACVWVIWKERNNQVFTNISSAPSTLIEKVKLTSFL